MMTATNNPMHLITAYPFVEEYTVTYTAMALVVHSCFGRAQRVPNASSSRDTSVVVQEGRLQKKGYNKGSIGDI